MRLIEVGYDEDKPENERSPDLDHNEGKSVVERGFVRSGLYDDCEYERKDRFGDRISHQESNTYPGEFQDRRKL